MNHPSKFSSHRFVSKLLLLVKGCLCLVVNFVRVRSDRAMLRPPFDGRRGHDHFPGVCLSSVVSLLALGAGPASAEVPGWWVLSSSQSNETEARAIIRAAKEAERILVVGQSENARLLYEMTVRDRTPNKVKRLERFESFQQVQKAAEQLDVDLVLGVSKEPISIEGALQRIAVPREIADHLRGAVSTAAQVAEAIRAITPKEVLNQPKVVKDFWKLTKTDTGFRRNVDLFVDRIRGESEPGQPLLQAIRDRPVKATLDTLDWADALLECAEAIDRDIKMSQQMGLPKVLMRSHVVEFLSKKGLETMRGWLIRPDRLKRIVDQRLISQSFADVLKLPDFGAVDLVTAGALYAGGDRGADTVTHFWDGVNQVAWGTLGLVASAGNPKAASAYQAFGDYAAKLGRFVTQPLFDGLVLWRRDVGKNVVEMWRHSQKVAAEHGVEIQSFEQLYGQDAAKFPFYRLHRAEIARETEQLRATARINAGGKPKPIKNVEPPSIWQTVHAQVTHDPRLQGDVTIARQIYESSRRILIVGTGQRGELIHEEIEKVVGPDRIVRERRTVSHFRVRQTAEGIDADLIVDVNPRRELEDPTHGPAMPQVAHPDPGPIRLFLRRDIYPDLPKPPVFIPPPPPPPGGQAVTLTSNSATYDPGGVSMNIEMKLEPTSEEHNHELEGIRQQVLMSRPGGPSLFWPMEDDKH